MRAAIAPRISTTSHLVAICFVRSSIDASVTRISVSDFLISSTPDSSLATRASIPSYVPPPPPDCKVWACSRSRPRSLRSRSHCGFMLSSIAIRRPPACEILPSGIEGLHLFGENIDVFLGIVAALYRRQGPSRRLKGAEHRKHDFGNFDPGHRTVYLFLVKRHDPPPIKIGTLHAITRI